MTRHKKRSQSGQGITEYASVIAFVAVLVMFAFSICGGALSSACSAAFNAPAKDLNNLAAAASR